MDQWFDVRVRELFRARSRVLRDASPKHADVRVEIVACDRIDDGVGEAVLRIDLVEAHAMELVAVPLKARAVEPSLLRAAGRVLEAVGDDVLHGEALVEELRTPRV